MPSNSPDSSSSFSGSVSNDPRRADTNNTSCVPPSPDDTSDSCLNDIAEVVMQNLAEGISPSSDTSESSDAKSISTEILECMFAETYGSVNEELKWLSLQSSPDTSGSIDERIEELELKLLRKNKAIRTLKRRHKSVVLGFKCQVDKLRLTAETLQEVMTTLEHTVAVLEKEFTSQGAAAHRLREASAGVGDVCLVELKDNTSH